MAYSAEERRILAHHVTDLDGDVYAVFNLPPEVVAVMFAYVSRSPRSFRDNLLKLVLSGDLDMGEVVDLYASAPPNLEAANQKARDFHERITLGYGHASVAELTSLAIGIENVSRLASAELELANRWLSFIEYSQRYQRPQRGRYVTPPELAERGDPALLDAFRRLQDACFDVYEALLDGLLPYLETQLPQREGESDKAYRSRLEKIAFEDARYALTLATQTNLGVTGNARAFRDAIVRLLSDPYRETTTLATAIRREGRKISPTLIRYAEVNPYQRRLWQEAGAFTALPVAHAAGSDAALQGARSVRLVDWTGRQPGDAPPAAVIADNTDVYLQPYAPGASGPAEHEALCHVLTAAHTRFGRYAGPGDLRDATTDMLLGAYRALLDGLGPHDHPDEALKTVRYTFELNLSEANWHQLLRHCRQIDFYPERPGIDAGYTCPPNVRAAGLADVLAQAVAESERVFALLVDAGEPLAAHYAVTNAHHRRVRADVTLWEMFHLINLRGKPDAQWDIRQTVLAMRELVRRVHPHLLEVERA